MKKSVVLLTLLLVFTTVTSVYAWLDFDDPVLCVQGEWLKVDAVKNAAVQVRLPAGILYGKDGGCSEPPAFPVIRNVAVDERLQDVMMVRIQANHATDTLTVTYGQYSSSQLNPGGLLLFAIPLVPPIH